jgi:hypothetical protein
MVEMAFVVGEHRRPEVIWADCVPYGSNVRRWWWSRVADGKMRVAAPGGSQGTQRVGWVAACQKQTPG